MGDVHILPVLPHDCRFQAAYGVRTVPTQQSVASSEGAFRALIDRERRGAQRLEELAQQWSPTLRVLDPPPAQPIRASMERPGKCEAIKGALGGPTTHRCTLPRGHGSTHYWLAVEDMPPAPTDTRTDTEIRGSLLELDLPPLTPSEDDSKHST